MRILFQNYHEIVPKHLNTWPQDLLARGSIKGLIRADLVLFEYADYLAQVADVPSLVIETQE